MTERKRRARRRPRNTARRAPLRELARHFLARYALAAAILFAIGLGLGFAGGYWIAQPSEPVAHAESEPPAAESPTTTALARRDDSTVEAARQRSAVAPGSVDDRPVIAIVLDDMGLDRRNAARATGLKKPLTLAFMSYADDLTGQMADAREHGHEVMLHVPMEPIDRQKDPGPNALLLGQGESELRRRLTWVLDRAKGYVGINNHMGSRFTRDEAAMSIVMAELKQRGLAFLDSRTTSESVAEATAHRFGVPVVRRDVFLDNDPAPDRIEAQLAKVEEIARRRGRAVAIGHPRPATLDSLERWLASIEARGFRLVPISALWLHRRDERMGVLDDQAKGERGHRGRSDRLE